MNHKAFTIHTQLIDGTLDGARNIYMGANRTCHLYVLPRNEVSLANSIDNITGNPAFYVLIGLVDGKQKAYIGQTTDFVNRKNDHVQKKDWWTIALVFISDNHNIYGDDVKYLEYLGIKKALEVNSISLFNASVPKKPNIAPDRVNDMQNFFDDIVLLANFYGVYLFNAKAEIAEIKDVHHHLFYVKATDRPAHGCGYYDATSGKFIIKKGSQLASTTVTSYKFKERDNIISKYCKLIGNEIILQEDYPMGSPSGASGLILGRPSNGNQDWIDAQGKTFGTFMKENQQEAKS